MLPDARNAKLIRVHLLAPILRAFGVCISTVDAYIMAAALEKTGNLAEQRHVLKNSVKWLPFIGYFLLDRGSIFVDRTRVDWDAFDTVCRRLRRNNVPVRNL